MKTRSASRKPSVTTRRPAQAIETLLDSSLRQVRTAPQQAIALARRAYEESVARAEDELAGRSLLLLGAGHRFLGKNDEALDYLREALAVGERIGNRTLLAQVHTEIGWVFVRTESARALEAFERAMTYVDDDSQPESTKIRSSIATVYRLVGAYEKAVPIYLHLIEHYSAIGEERRLAVAYDNLGCVYGELRDYDTCVTYFQRSIDVARRCGYIYGEATALSNLGEAYCQHETLQEALVALRQAYDIYSRLEEPDGITRTLQSIGDLHERRGESRTALSQFRRALKTARAHGNLRNIGYALSRIGRLQLSSGKAEQAVRSLTRGLDAAKRAGDVKLQYMIHEMLSSGYEQLGDYRQALDCLRRYTDTKDAVIDEQTHARIAEIQARHDLERSEREKEIYRLKSERLEQELRLRTSELTAMALRLVERSEVLDSVKSELSQVLTIRNGDAHPLLETILSKIDTHGDADHEWSRFEERFRRVHPDFVRRITERYPSLSPTELKVCTLLRTELTSKEIARLLHVSLRDIENHRYHIRKKLLLDSATNLGSFLAAF